MRENAPVSVLANRYASSAMRSVFAPEEKIIAERKLWIAVARAQSKLGHAIADSVIADYEKVITQVDLASIDKREKATRHDVKARIEEFNALAGHEVIHAGMTSRDLTENIEALQIRDGLSIVHDKVVALLAALGVKATEYAEQPIAGRSHNVPAQVTTLGKRFASAAEELLYAYERLVSLQNLYPLTYSVRLRPIKNWKVQSLQNLTLATFLIQQARYIRAHLITKYSRHWCRLPQRHLHSQRQLD